MSTSTVFSDGFNLAPRPMCHPEREAPGRARHPEAFAGAERRIEARTNIPLIRASNEVIPL